MTLTEKILKGIVEAEFEINPELQKKQPKKGKYSTSHVMSSVQDYAKMGVLNIFSGPKVEFPGDPKKYDVTSDTNMFADLHERVQKSMSWWRWNEDEKQFMLKPGFTHTAPSFWAAMLDLVDYYYDTYEEQSKAGGETREPESQDDEEVDYDDGVVIGEPEVSVYNRENGGTGWEFASGYTVSGRLSANDLVIDAEASSVFLDWHPYGKVKQVFEWFATNLPSGTSIIVINVAKNEYLIVKRLQHEGRIDGFTMRE